MSFNSSLALPLRGPNMETVDTQYILTKLATVFSFVTFFVGITGNSLVIWVAGFKLKVENIGEHFSFNQEQCHWVSVFCGETSSV